ncbi:putative transcription factor interactor and regulator CCHC(Zn) family [Helianthus annuus]|nr:putative transcription factor interactor and regulator CCHC(Zn) family [Helianthus annuus]
MSRLSHSRRKSKSSKRRSFDKAFQRAFEKMLPDILQTFDQHIHNRENNVTPPSPPPSPPPRSPTPPPLPPPFPPNISPPKNDVSYNNTTLSPSVDIYTWLARFQKQKPRSFSSATVPVEAQNWINHIEKIFEVMGVGEEFKARLATYKLEDDAQSWWGTVKHARGGDFYVATLSWNDFKTLFYQQYFPSARRGEYEREYASIKQREDEPMVEFMARFTRLASFMGPAAGTPLMQADKLKWAVCEKIKWLIVNQEFKDITEVANAVQNLEIANKDMKLQYDEIHKKNQTSSTRDHKLPFSQNSNTQHQNWQQTHQNPKTSNHPYQTNRKSPNQNQNHSGPLCNTCGKFHKGVCFKATDNCFRCGQSDHMVKNCPKPQGYVIGNYVEPASVVPRTTGGRVFALTTGIASTEAELAKKRLKHHELIGREP